MFLKYKLNLFTLLLIFTAQGVYAESTSHNLPYVKYDGSSQSQSSSLGASSNPAPQSLGGMPFVPSNMGQSTGLNPYFGAQVYSQNNAANFSKNQNGVLLHNPGNNNSQSALYYSAGPVPQGQPAWSQGNYYSQQGYILMPFGASLFRGHFANTYADNLNASYIISPGDRIVIRIWGAKQYDDVLVVDQQGNIFVPEIGPIKVAGATNAKLLSTVKSRIASIFTDNIEVYVNLQSAQPVGVYVTGFVPQPGQYAGGSHDSLLSFIDRAGGIDISRGSFREIQLLRGGKVVATYDLYDFILKGKRPAQRLNDGDVILVKEKTNEVRVIGDVRQEALYELKKANEGQSLISMASPAPSVSHVSVSGIRDNIPVHYYLSLNEFKKFKLSDGDVVDFVADRKGESVIAKISGAIVGPSRFPVGKDVTLRELLSFVEVDPNLADTSSIYIRRKSVAMQQQKAINDSLRRLEQSALTATSSSVDEAKIRVQEADLIQDFVKRAGQIEPDGIVVVSRGGVVSDIRLEDGDEVIIPQLSDVVLVTGEVMMPKAVTFDEDMSLDDYLGAAGGVSNRADDSNILVAKVNGEVGLADDLGIAPGDRVMVMPRFDSKNMQLAKDIMQIMYQMAVATKVIVDL
ncbi:Polysialic acid transport protein kpsD precursor [Anaerobiospirillum thomasii]|uniref:polysaccharide biosynthesis/export family protein n=1 Tax=Anaerobiospirillum thomasii TaxID=179995 RepID=UPI000D8135F8|nr:polysaccharide biosynthesis/export family protein [Anaerobiospirillum thomasii]SPT68370.1 Polysialic acid transport protein kpsD precursor [Anaerobiospirillum thomasii]